MENGTCLHGSLENSNGYILVLGGLASMSVIDGGPRKDKQTVAWHGWLLLTNAAAISMTNSA